MAIKDYSTEAANCIETNLTDDDWSHHSDTLMLAQEAIMNSYSNILGDHLRAIFAIGKEKYSEDQQERYIDKCITVAKTALQLLCFTYISDLWNKKRKKDFDLKGDMPEEYIVLKRFFEYAIGKEYDLDSYFKLFLSLNNVYLKQQLSMPVALLENLYEQLKPDSNFYIACTQLSLIQKTRTGDKYTDKNCDLAEINLTTFLCSLSFLASWKMVSIKSVDYTDIKNMEPRYLHKFVHLGKYVATTSVNYLSSPINTDAILLFKDTYVRDNINLFPFILDYTALTAAANEVATNAKICFFSAQATLKDSDDENAAPRETMRLYFADDETTEIIINSGELQSEKPTNFNAIFKNGDKTKQFKQDTVFLQFWDARKTILGT